MSQNFTEKKKMLIITISAILCLGTMPVLAQPISSNPKILNVLVIEQDPYLKTKNNTRASDYLFGAGDQRAKRVVSELVDDINYSSHGNVIVNIVKKEHLDEFATFNCKGTLANGKDPSRLDEATWLEVMKNGQWMNHWFQWDPLIKDIERCMAYSYSYEYLIDKFNLINRKNNGEFDEIWHVNIDPSHTYESVMVGSTAYWINGRPITHDINGKPIILTSNFKIMNLALARPDVNYECFGHAAETILNKVFSPRYDSYHPYDEIVNKDKVDIDNLMNYLNPWERFTLTDFSKPGYASVGNVHFAPNSIRDYDWENKTIVESSWIDWLDYPNLTGKTKASNSADWVPFVNAQFSGARQHHRWWFSLMPHCEGRTKEGYSNNWWDYLFNGDYVTRITNNYSKTEYKVDEYITLNYELGYHTGKIEHKTLNTIGSYDLHVHIGNYNIVKLEDGVLKAVSAGNTNIRVYYDNKYADFPINVSSGSGVEINYANFPDNNFRTWLLAQPWGIDGVITEAEFAGITSINVSEKNIRDLKGIDYFTALEGLNVYDNQLTSLDLSKNTKIKLLDVSYNKLTGIDLSKHELLEFFAGNNQTPTITITGFGDNFVSDNKYYFNCVDSLAINWASKGMFTPNDFWYNIGGYGNFVSKSNTITSLDFEVFAGGEKQNSENPKMLNGTMNFVYICTHDDDKAFTGLGSVKTPGTCQKAAIHKAICNSCGIAHPTGGTIEGVMENHEYTGWQIKTPATCHAIGEETEKCSVCEELGIATKPIPQLTGRDCEVVSIKPNPTNSKNGIKFAQNPVSDKVKINVILPNGEKVSFVNIAIYDMTSNVVFSTTADNGKIIWDLRNSAGRFVANGSYLVVVEIKSSNGNAYHYSAKLGVKK